MVQNALITEHTTALTTEPTLAPVVRDKRKFGEVLGTFLDVTGTMTGRATFYNAKEDQEAAEIAAHEKLFAYDRVLYGALLTLPGVTDRAKQHGMVRLLSDKSNGGALRLASESVATVEDKILGALVDDVTVPRMMKAFVMLRDAKVNNARTRRIVLRSLLKNKGLEIRAVRYRDKFAEVLRHIFGQKKAGVLRAILERPRSTWETHETKFIKEQLGRYARFSDDNVLQVAVAYALGSSSEFVMRNTSTPLIKAVFEARHDLSKGKDLPFEVLEGIRSVYHKGTKSAQVLEMANTSKAGLTQTQKMNLQAKAARDGVRVDFDPSKQDAVKLYIYAYERGLTDEIIAALDQKAKAAALMMPAKHRKVGILVDDSLSSFGDVTQKLRPLAVALATRDMLTHASEEEAVVRYASGKNHGRLAKPEGDTSLSEGLVDILLEGVDVVYVISDGYENAPAGRFAETVERLRAMQIDTPIIHMSPVAAAEAKGEGLRQLVPELKAVAVADPQAMSTSLLRVMVDADPVLATSTLLRMAFNAKALGNLSEVKLLEG